MSTPQDKVETQQQQQKGPEAFLSIEERKMLQRILSFPEELPQKFASWIVEYMKVNAEEIPASAIVGSERESVSCRLRRTSDQTGFTGGVRTNVIWTEAEWDPSSMWDGTSKVTVPRPGKYLVISVVEWSVFAGVLEIWKNNATREDLAPATTGNRSSVRTILDMKKNDYVEIKVVPDNSASEILFEANHTPYAVIARISA